MEIVFSQPAPPPQFDSSPRLSLAVGTGLDEPGVPRAETQSTERKWFFPLQASLDGCTSLDWKDTTNVPQSDVEMEPETATTAQAAARGKFARPPNKRQQGSVTAWGNKQSKQFDPRG